MWSSVCSDLCWGGCGKFFLSFVINLQSVKRENTVAENTFMRFFPCVVASVCFDPRWFNRFGPKSISSFPFNHFGCDQFPTNEQKKKFVIVCPKLHSNASVKCAKNWKTHMLMFAALNVSSFHSNLLRSAYCKYSEVWFFTNILKKLHTMTETVRLCCLCGYALCGYAQSVSLFYLLECSFEWLSLLTSIDNN